MVGPPVAAFSYDSESRQVSATVGGVTGIYGYDGEGRRVTKQGPAGQVVFVYDASGGLVAEYGGVADTGDTRWVVADHLGSTRALVGPGWGGGAGVRLPAVWGGYSGGDEWAEWAAVFGRVHIAGD